MGFPHLLLVWAVTASGPVNAGVSLFSDQFVCLAVGSAYISCKLQKGKSCHWPPVTLESLISNLPGTEVVTTLTMTHMLAECPHTRENFQDGPPDSGIPVSLSGIENFVLLSLF